MKDKKLIWYLYPSYLLVIFISLSLLLLYSVNAFKTFYFNQTTNDLRARTILIETQVLPYFKHKDFEKLNLLLTSQGNSIQTRFTLIDPNGVVIVDSEENPNKMNNHSNRPEIRDAMKGKESTEIRYSNTLNTKMLYFAKPVLYNGQTIGIIRSSIPINLLDIVLKKLKNQMLFWGLIISLFSGIIGFFVSKKISAPIIELTEGADQFSKGNFDFKIALPKTHEFKKLAIAFNHMSAQLKERMHVILKQSNEKETILANMIEGVITINTQGQITTINQAAKHYFHIKNNNVLGTSIFEIIKNEDLQNVITHSLSSKIVIETDIRLNSPEEKFFQVHGISLKDSFQNITGAMIVLHDVTRIKKLEDVRREFVSNVSHELKTPITLIKGFLETLLHGASDVKEEREEFLAIISKHTNRLDEIIEDLLELSRIEQANEKNIIDIENTEMNSVINNAIHACKTKADIKKITLNFNNTHPCYASINCSLIEQAMINLIDNAIKYSPIKSEINIDLAQTNTQTIILVKDQGVGIPKDHLPHLFERFYRVDKSRSRDLGGTGLGLSIVKHIAQAHNGNVIVESIEGKGSCFTISIPTISMTISA